MASAHDDEDAGFWPGYVAAVSGLVQGLLIMAMALGISIFALAHIRVTEGPAKALEPPTEGPLPGFETVKPAPPPRPELTPPPPPTLALPPEALRPIYVSYVGDAAITPASAARAIEQAVSGRQSLGVSRWVIEAGADLDDPRLRRVGYLRIMAVRSVLMNAGVPGSAIDMKLRNDASATSNDGSGSVVVSARADRLAAVSVPREAGK